MLSPNPFESMNGPACLQWLGLEIFLVVLARTTVGIFYNTGDCPPLGATAFFIVYVIYACFFSWLNTIGLSWGWAMGIMGVLIGLAKWAKNKIKYM